ncbi:hypothetical protein N7453_006110 [Penicillium expansum]|nr:hypothetical protein N7453_006110 [Penicillium expansum]
MPLGNCKIIFALNFPVSKGKSLPRDWDDHWQFPHRVISNFDHPGSIARQHRSYHDHEAPGQKVPSRSEVSDPVGMDGKTRHQSGKDPNGKKRGNMLWMALDADQRLHSSSSNSSGCFFASPWRFLLSLDNHPGSSPANPKPCRCSTEEQPRKKTCSPAETLSVKNCPSSRTPRANNKWIMVFGADIPCNVTKTSERHERPLHMCLAAILEASVAGWNAKARWAEALPRELGPNLQGTFRPPPPPSTIRQKAGPVVQVVWGSFPSDVISTVMRGCREFDVSMQSLEPSNNRTVEACDIFLPDDRFAVNGVQDCCQPSLAPGLQIWVASRVGRCENLPRLESKACKKQTGFDA